MCSLFLRLRILEELYQAGGRSTTHPQSKCRSRVALPAATLQHQSRIRYGDEMASTRVSLCMIVKNEEANLPRCLGSVADLVDEIVVVDTGSSDQTGAIARD